MKGKNEQNTKETRKKQIQVLKRSKNRKAETHIVTYGCKCCKPALRRLKQDGSAIFEASLGNMMALCHKTTDWKPRTRKEH